MVLTTNHHEGFALGPSEGDLDLPPGWDHAREAPTVILETAAGKAAEVLLLGDGKALAHETKDGVLAIRIPQERIIWQVDAIRVCF